MRARPGCRQQHKTPSNSNSNGGTRPTFVAYGSVPAVQRIQLAKIKDTGDAAVLIVPHPDAHGYQKREVWAVLDVVREVRR